MQNMEHHVLKKSHFSSELSYQLGVILSSVLIHAHTHEALILF